MFWASLVSMIGVGLLFVAGFGGVRHALLANLILLVGMAWAFGYVTLAVGHLNILSVTFTVTMIGIGIDFGVYYVARYLQLRGESHDLRGRRCWRRPAAPARRSRPARSRRRWRFSLPDSPASRAWPSWASSPAAALLLCALAELVDAAGLHLSDRPQRLGHANAQAVGGAPLDRSVLADFRGFTLVVTLVLHGRRVGRPEPAVVRQQPAQHAGRRAWKAWRSKRSCWPSAIKACGTPCRSPTAAKSCWRARPSSCKLGSVERTEEIVSLLPVDLEVKQPIIARIQQRLAALPERPPLITRRSTGKAGTGAGTGAGLAGPQPRG